MEGFWSLTGYGFWIVEEKRTGRFLGEVGVADFKRAITPSLAGKPEFGWIIVGDAHRQGYATEAIGAALAWAKENLAAEKYCCIIDPDNAPSIRVAENCGFKEKARTTYKKKPIIILERPSR
ncbi:MAG: GNAT family N-acetyltransferase, partial [Parvularculaceae bacterium]